LDGATSAIVLDLCRNGVPRAVTIVMGIRTRTGATTGADGIFGRGSRGRLHVAVADFHTVTERHSEWLKRAPTENHRLGQSRSRIPSLTEADSVVLKVCHSQQCKGSCSTRDQERDERA